LHVHKVHEGYEYEDRLDVQHKSDRYNYSQIYTIQSMCIKKRNSTMNVRVLYTENAT
jgi:hypothetical protein